MTLKKDILALLEENRGADLSGQALAEHFGVSRNAVWKAISTLKQEGYKIEAAPNRGYRLASDCDRLSAESVRVHLRHPIDLFVFDTIDSTNNEAKRMVSSGYSGCALVIAGEQTGGRGRLGRSFYSPADTGIYLSLILQPKDSISKVMRITAAAALAVCSAIEECSGLCPMIKWVNDIYLGDRKICGILSEAVTDIESGTVQSVVVGIGINITTSDFPAEISDRASSIGMAISRPLLAAAVCDRLLDLWKRLSDPALMEDYRRRSLVIGKEIDFYSGQEKRTGKAVGIDDDGGLLVECDGETVALSTGEISIRLKGGSL
ncbi:MAG: biotin--[acetyl-CoA-carboxylase] ligase [Eubacteriales bacterium]